MRRLARIALPFSMVAFGATSVRAQQPTYQVRDTIPIGGEGGWDYLTVDTARGRLFVSDWCGSGGRLSAKWLAGASLEKAVASDLDQCARRCGRCHRR